MHESRSEQSARRTWSWFDPEMLAYALVGLLVVGLGARALASWVGVSWANGQRVLPTAVLCLVAATVGAFLFALRRRKGLLYLGLVLVAVGSVSYLLASAGVTLPRSWVE
jgi:hypothetical protein